jgi:plasmid stabilization system protein ParE
MAKPLKFLDEAVREGHNAWRWYRERSERAGLRFQKAFEQAVEELVDHPDRWPVYHLGTKCISLKRFPYIIVYRELEDELQIVAVAHAHRRQGYWRKRLK